VAKKKAPKTAPLILTVGSMDPSTLRQSGYSVRRPTWKQIEDAIRQMDGHWRCEVIIMVDDETYHLLGGGADDRYVCEAENPDGNFALCDPTQSDEELVDIFNGQPSLYAARHVVDFARVLQAARYFATKREMDPSLVWDQY
jgi:Immunity protein Imm1